MPSPQQRALVPFYFSANFSVTSTPTEFLLSTSGDAFSPYLKSYLSGAVPKGFQATLHSMILFYTSLSLATSMTAAITNDSESAQSPLYTLSPISKSNASSAGVMRMDTPLTSIFIMNSTTGNASMRLATNAGTLTVQAVVMVFEFHAP